MNQKNQSMDFKAEVKQLLDILSHSLYKERDIFLRELISNASDALSRVQFQMLTQNDVFDAEAELAIHIDADEETKTLTISDSGIGMTYDELIENLGTIAHSGVKTFMESLEQGQKPSDIIGQFGVGFYAVFMVAEEVRVTSRSYLPDAQAWTWIATGDSTFDLEPAEKEDRGTTITVKLKEDASEFTSSWRLEQIVKKHSNYVSFPVYVGETVANQREALWRKSRSEVTEEEYEEFYRQLTYDSQAPLLPIHVVADVPVDVHSLLFIPGDQAANQMRMRSDYGLKLYCQKVLIQERNKELLPEYFRFIEGVVDSADIPLNVARETVQSNRTIGHIKKALRGRIIKTLRDLGEEEPETYTTFWRTWGAYIKEGVATDFGGREDLLPLLRFVTTKSDGELISLETYLEHKVEDQDAIYYIIGDSLESVSRSPHLDYFKAHDLEVLYMVDPLDAFMVQSLREYEGTALRSVDDPDLDLPEAETANSDEETDTVSAENLSKLILRIKETLDERVSDVKETKVLTNSACRLVSEEGGPARDLQRVRRLLEQDFVVPPMVLEINRSHPLIVNLSSMVETDFANPLIDMSIEQMFENMLLIEGLHPNPAQMVSRLQSLLEKATQRN